MKRKYCLTIVVKVLIAQFILNFVGLIIGYTWGLNVEDKKWNQLIYSDIKVGNIDIGGRTKEEARDIIKSNYIDAMLNKKLYVTVDDKIYSMDNVNLIKSYEIDNVIDKAFNFGKNLSKTQKHNLVKNGSNKNYSLDFTYNEDVVKSFTAGIEKEINLDPVNAAIEVKSNGKIQIHNDIKGRKLEKEKLHRSIEDKVKTEGNKDIHITASVEMTDAEITQTTLSGIDKCISSFNTSFKSSSYMRANNIDVSVNAINGKILMPGEVFSFNDTVGERTKERGYMEATVIIDKKFNLGIGGGICQVSTALYNAVLKAGIEPIERTGHSLPIAYAEVGLDAAVDFGNIDFKFKNTWDYPIYIQAYTQNRNLHINIFSNSNVNSKNI